MSLRGAVILPSDLFSYGESVTYIVGCRGASQPGGSLVGIPPGFKANKL